MAVHTLHRCILTTLAGLALVGTGARADTILTQRTKIRGAGDLGRMEIVRTIRVSGDKERVESNVKFSGSVATETGARPVDETGIVRLDRGMSLTLDPAVRTFSQRSFIADREYLQRIAAEADTSTNCMEAPGIDPVVSEHTYPDTRKVGAWDATYTTLTARTEVIDLKSGFRRSAEVALDLWMATGVPGSDEVRSFEFARSSRVGLASEIFPSLEGLAGGYEHSMAKLRDAYGRLSGFPVQWSLTVRTDLSSEERAALADAAKLQEEGADPTQQERQAADASNLSDPLAGVTTRSPESAQDKLPPHPLEPAAGENLTTTSADQEVDTQRGMTIVLRADSVLESAKTVTEDPAQFEVPAGYAPAPAAPR